MIQTKFTKAISQSCSTGAAIVQFFLQWFQNGENDFLLRFVVLSMQKFSTLMLKSVNVRKKI